MSCVVAVACYGEIERRMREKYEEDTAEEKIYARKRHVDF